MLARIVSLLLIAAVIACPLECGMGLCEADQCAGNKSSQRSRSTSEAACCCCEQSLPDSDDDNSSPCDCPENSSCQGVCGGAVFEKLCEPDRAEATCFLPRTDTQTSLVSRLAQCRLVAVGDHAGCGQNQGRMLRTRHMSFLC
jgi:hypothetical protein